MGTAVETITAEEPDSRTGSGVEAAAGGGVTWAGRGVPCGRAVSGAEIWDAAVKIWTGAAVTT